jgi:Flp pilus assembly protein TadG
MSRRPRTQAGQAIVLIALLLVALFGFLGLAVDGGRVYLDRRELQLAADSATLAMADTYTAKLDMAAAEQAAISVFAANTRIYGSASTANVCANPSDPPPNNPPNPTCETTVAWSGDSHTLKLSYYDNRWIHKGIQFNATATHSLPLAFMQVVGAGTGASLGATASSVIYDQGQTPAILALAKAPCDGTSQNALTVQGGNGLNVTVAGEVFSDGSIGIGNGADLNVLGNAYEHCGSLPIPGISNSGYGQYSPVAPLYLDYSGGTSLPVSANYQTNQNWPGQTGNVEVYPGVYQTNPQIAGGTPCYFLDPGQYYYPGGFTVTKGFTSNELRPPDEAAYYNSTIHAGAPPAGDPSGTSGDTNYQQLWRANSTCDGAFQPTVVADSGHPITSSGSWGFVVTAGRQDVYYPNSTTPTPTPPVYYTRESAPSMCRQASPNGSNVGIQVGVSNVPGAQWYNVYATPGGCTQSGNPVAMTSFGYLGSFCSGVQVPTGQSAVGGCSGTFQQSNNKSACPNLPTWSGSPNPAALPVGGNANTANCTLGWAASQVFDYGNGLSGFSATGAQCPSRPTPANPAITNCAPPDAEACPLGVNGCITASPNAPAAFGTTASNGDRADENQCADYTGANVACRGLVTPGAVQFVFDNSSKSCLSESGSGAVWAFGGQQYSWIVVYSTNSTCTGANANNIVGGTATSYKGTFYMPDSSITLSGGGQNAVASQVIALYVTIDGSSGVTIAFNPNYTPLPPAGRLVQ